MQFHAIVNEFGLHSNIDLDLLQQTYFFNLNLELSKINLGTNTIIFVWASWSTFSRIENRETLSKISLDNPVCYDVIGISIDEDVVTWKSAVKEDKLFCRQYLAPGGKNSDLMVKILSDKQLPQSFVISNNQVVEYNISAGRLQELVLGM